VITRGERRPLAAFGTELIERPTPAVAVVDTVGAGDTFHAALLAHLDAHGSLTPQAASAWTAETVTQALDFAAAAAAIVCTRRGANPPRWDEVASFLKGAAA
jgi:fructokinase